MREVRLGLVLLGRRNSIHEVNRCERRMCSARAQDLGQDGIDKRSLGARVAKLGHLNPATSRN
jgi:hypothetical protein